MPRLSTSGEGWIYELDSCFFAADEAIEQDGDGEDGEGGEQGEGIEGELLRGEIPLDGGAEQGERDGTGNAADDGGEHEEAQVDVEEAGEGADKVVGDEEEAQDKGGLEALAAQTFGVGEDFGVLLEARTEAAAEVPADGVRDQTGKVAGDQRVKDARQRTEDVAGCHGEQGGREEEHGADEVDDDIEEDAPRGGGKEARQARYGLGGGEVVGVSVPAPGSQKDCPGDEGEDAAGGAGGGEGHGCWKYFNANNLDGIWELKKMLGFVSASSTQPTC